MQLFVNYLFKKMFQDCSGFIYIRVAIKTLAIKFSFQKIYSNIMLDNSCKDIRRFLRNSFVTFYYVTILDCPFDKVLNGIFIKLYMIANILLHNNQTISEKCF